MRIGDNKPAMPAIRPALLKQQAALVADHFADPAAFVRSLGHLLELYADRVQRPGMAGTPRPLLPAYHVRPPVLRQVLKELTQRAEVNPDQGLAICDLLWEQPYLECRQLAIQLLGQIPTANETAIIDRIKKWLPTTPETTLVELLLSQGFTRLRQEKPLVVIDQVDTWLVQKHLKMQQTGLRALLPMVKDARFENLPVFFRLLQPLLGVIPTDLRPDLLTVLEALARRSPQETALFLRQSLHLPNHPDLPWLIRQLLPGFPTEIGNNLRSALRASRQ